MKKEKNRAYLFDFDGTLVDSMPTFVSVMLRILDEYGIKYDRDIVKVITPLGYHGTAEYYRALGINAPTEVLIGKMNAYALNEYACTIPAKATVSETLRELKARGNSLNVLTASPHTMLDVCLKRLGLWDVFDHVWSCDDFGTTKSNPEIYKMASERIGKDVGEIIFVDDNINAVKTAKLAGMRSYAIYDPSSAEYEDEMRAIADRYMKEFAELLDE